MSDSVASELFQLVLSQRMIFATSATVFYDYAITFGDEVRTVWQRKFSVVSLLIVTLRWSLLVGAVANIASGTPESCSALMWAATIPIYVCLLQMAVFSALRVCALWNRNYLLFAVVFLLSVVPLCTNIYEFSHASSEYIPSPFNICGEDVNITDQAQFDLVMISRSCSIAGDVLVLVSTWLKTYSVYHQVQATGIKSPLTTCLLHDGTAFFLVLLILNTTEIMAWYISSASNVAQIAVVMSPLLVSRFMMRLRLATRHEHLTTTDMGTLVPAQSVVFANAGAPLDFTDDTSWDDDEDVGDEQETPVNEGPLTKFTTDSRSVRTAV